MAKKKEKINIAVLVSGGGTNLQALIDSTVIKSGVIRLVISSNASAYALKRAKNAKIKSEIVDKLNYPTLEKREEKKNIEDNSSRKENNESIYNNIDNFQKREVSWWNTYPSAENSEYLNTEKKNWVNNPIEEKQQKQSISTNYLQEDVFKNF